MEHALERALELDEVGHVVLDELKAGVALQVGDVRGFARDEVVHPDHAVPLREQPVAQVRAQEPRGPGYEDAHARRRPRLS